MAEQSRGRLGPRHATVMAAMLSDSDHEQIAGDQHELVGRMQRVYGYNKEQAEREVAHLFKKL